jgi:uncharacterized protein YjbI with pentapeptide repeats
MSLITKLKHLCKNKKQDTKNFYEKYKKFKIPSLPIIREKVSQHSKTCLFVIVILFLIYISFIQQFPHWQVSQFKINNSTEVAQLENSYRATLAQILGGFAIEFGLYYTWRRITIAEDELRTTKENLEVSKESQITERFTRAIGQLGATDQSGNPATEIRLGGIYALERIANESVKDYWPIMEILTAYVRKNSSFDSRLKEKPIESKAVAKVIQLNKSINNEYSKERNEYSKKRKLPLDIQGIVAVIRRRKHYLHHGESNPLNLEMTCLQGAYLEDAHLEGTSLRHANLEEVQLYKAHLEKADLSFTNLIRARLGSAHLNGADFEGANLENANLHEAHLKGAHLKIANLKGAYLSGADLEEADLEGANLTEARLWDANIEKAHLMDARLDGAYLNGANLKGAYLNGANLEGADLTKAHLDGADLEGSYLNSADFEGANLSNANLNGAKLRGANLNVANLIDAIFDGTLLEKINLKRNDELTIKQLSNVKTFYMADLDESLHALLKKRYPALFKVPE